MTHCNPSERGSYTILLLQVFMKELERLLKEDLRCVEGYEFLHYKESEDLKFSDTVLEKLKHIERQTTAVPQTKKAEVVIDSLKKNL